MKKFKFLTALVIVSSLILTACSPSEEQITADPDSEYIYRVIEDDSGLRMIIDEVEKMSEYPEGIDFNSLEEADKYIDKKGGGGYL